MDFSWAFFFAHLFEPSSIYLEGLWLTLSLSVIAQLLGTVLGFTVALGRLSTLVPLRVIAGFYVWIMRGTPLLVQIVFIYTGFAAANIFRFQDIDLGFVVLPGNIQAGVLALSLNEGAYMGEIVRAGIASIDRGQIEAARSLGMSPMKVMRRIILPQATRLIIPPAGNEFNGMLKNTTLLSVIGVPELLQVTQEITSLTFRVFELYAVVALYYLSLTTLWGIAQHRLERHYSKPFRTTTEVRREAFWRRMTRGYGRNR
jgi:polar amino acid transport system permease protein